MAAPRGITKDQALAAATALLREAGAIDGVTLGAVASRIGIRTQSLYAHIHGVAGLRRELALRGLSALSHQLTEAAVGTARADAIAAIIRAYLRFALEEPGLYDASLRPPGDDDEVRDAVSAVMRPLTLVFASYGLDLDASTHCYRMVFAGVFGFAALERASLMTLPVSLDDTVEQFIEAMVRHVEFVAHPSAHGLRSGDE